MTVQPASISRPWWSYVRMSVRGLIVLVLLIGAGLGWIVRSARIQRNAVVAIEKAGGSVSYDWERSNGNDVPGGKPWAPRWLVDLVGVDYFGHVTAVCAPRATPLRRWLRSGVSPDSSYCRSMNRPSRTSIWPI